MAFHPHLHCILSAGGWNDSKQQWIEPKKLNSGFFIPQKVVAACFKKHFLFAFSQLWEDGKLNLPKELLQLNNPDEFKHFYNQIAFKKGWIVKIMPPLDNPQRVIEYLGRYVYRIAITDSRIKEVKIKERQVIFDYKDYAAQTNDNTPPPLKIMVLDALEFIRRFAQHTLPKGFQKMRYFGIYATAYRKNLLPTIAQKMGSKPWNATIRSVCQILTAFIGHDPNICPYCGAAKLVAVTLLPVLSLPNAIQIVKPIARPPPTILP